MTTTRLEYTHDIILVERTLTSKGDPMWICSTRQEDKLYIFSNQMGRGIWSNGWGTHFITMADGDSLRWESTPIQVNAEFDGKYWRIYAVAPKPKDAQPDIVPVPPMTLYAQSIHTQIGYWQKESVSIFDTETTGLDVNTDEIVSMACVGWQDTRLVNDYEVAYQNLFIKPEHPEKLLQKSKGGKSPFDIHGIDPKRVRACPPFPQAYPIIKQALAYTHWICWNAPYDVALLDSLCIRHELSLIPRLSVTCAMRLTAPVFGDWNPSKAEFASKSLEDAATHYGINADAAHNAYGDVLMTRAVLEAVLEDLRV